MVNDRRPVKLKNVRLWGEAYCRHVLFINLPIGRRYDDCTQWCMDEPADVIGTRAV